jgi:hypothetical protein
MRIYYPKIIFNIQIFVQSQCQQNIRSKLSQNIAEYWLIKKGIMARTIKSPGFCAIRGCQSEKI